MMKTLCEVGQKRSESKPGFFLGEIIRAVFSLPTAQLKLTADERHRQYDDAHSTVENCAEKFSACTGSVWSPNFILNNFGNE